MRIFDNVFSNIYKYADKSSAVKIAVSSDACNVKVRFENEIRLDGERVESNGIGLKTCKKLAELMAVSFDAAIFENTFAVNITLKYTDREPEISY